MEIDSPDVNEEQFIESDRDRESHHIIGGSQNDNVVAEPEDSRPISGGVEGGDNEACDAEEEADIDREEEKEMPAGDHGNEERSDDESDASSESSRKENDLNGVGQGDADDVAVAVESEETRRLRLLDEYHAVLRERTSLVATGRDHERRIAEILLGKSALSGSTAVVAPQSSAADIARYNNSMTTLRETRQLHAQSLDALHRTITELTARAEEKRTLLEKARDEFRTMRSAISASAIVSHNGTTIPPEEWESQMAQTSKKEQEVSTMRLENIKLSGRLRQVEGTLARMDRLGEGAHLVDYEQLRVENRALAAKLNDRSDEQLKWREKNSQTTQIMAHVKEKLRFTERQNEKMWREVRDLDGRIGEQRAVATHTKRARDYVRAANGHLKRDNALVSNHTLLRDFEEQHDALEDATRTLALLQERHAQLVGK